MLLNNPLQMNDWKFSQFIKLTLAIQFLLLIFVGLNLKGINIPVIAQLIGFIYLTFIPGYLILRVLKIHEIGNVKSLLYSVGLSIASVMFIGFIYKYGSTTHWNLQSIIHHPVNSFNHSICDCSIHYKLHT